MSRIGKLKTGPGRIYDDGRTAIIPLNPTLLARLALSTGATDRAWSGCNAALTAATTTAATRIIALIYHILIIFVDGLVVATLNGSRQIVL